MNLSETAFATRLDGRAHFNLRWFTPNTEVNLCGHATLATAHVLWEEGHVPPDQVPRFETRSGLLSARRGPARHRARLPARGRRVGGDLDRGAGQSLKSAIPAPIRFAGSESFRRAGRAGRRGDARERSAPTSASSDASLVPGGDRHQPVGRSGLRLRLAVLRAPRRRGRGSRLRLGPLLPRPVLGREAGASRSWSAISDPAAGASSGSGWKVPGSSSSAGP